MLSVRNLTIGYGGEPAVEGIDLDVAAGQFVSLIGPSGSGKSSILRAVTGLVPPGGGSVALDVPVLDVGFLFQDDALLPWRTARENVALGLRIRAVARPAAEAQAGEWLSLLGLDRHGGQYPRQLSGGQRKRVAMAQVLALKPRLLLCRCSPTAGSGHTWRPRSWRRSRACSAAWRSAWRSGSRRRCLPSWRSCSSPR